VLLEPRTWRSEGLLEPLTPASGVLIDLLGVRQWACCFTPDAVLIRAPRDPVVAMVLVIRAHVRIWYWAYWGLWAYWGFWGLWGDAGDARPAELSLVLRKHLRASLGTNVALDLAQERFALVGGVFFHKEPGPCGADEIDRPQATMDGLASMLPRLGGMAYTD